jgi:O-antigen ligase
MYFLIILILASSPFVKYTIEIGPSSMNISDFFLASGMYIWILSIFMKEKIKLLGSNLLLPFALFICIMIASYFVSAFPDRSLTYICAFIFKLCSVFFFANNVKTTKNLHQLIIFWICLGIGITLFGIRYSLSMYQSMPSYGEVLTYVTFRNKTEYAYNLICPALLGMSLVSSLQMRSWKTILLGIVTFFLIIAIILSLSRGMWISLFLGILFILYYSRTKIKIYVKYATGIILILLSIMVVPQKYRVDKELIARANSLREAIHERSGSIKERGYAYSAGWNMLLSMPLLGFGAGTFDLEMNPYMPADKDDMVFGHGELMGTYGMEAHNSYITLLTGVGIIGGFSFFWILIRARKHIIRSIHYSSGLREGRSVIIGLSASFFALLAANLFFDSLASLELWFVLGLIVAFRKIYCQAF